jgi:hypothetical protein
MDDNTNTQDPIVTDEEVTEETLDGVEATDGEVDEESASTEEEVAE